MDLQGFTSSSGKSIDNPGNAGTNPLTWKDFQILVKAKMKIQIIRKFLTLPIFVQILTKIEKTSLETATMCLMRLVGTMIYFKYVELVSTSSALPLFVQVSIFYILPYLGYLFGVYKALFSLYSFCLRA